MIRNRCLILTLAVGLLLLTVPLTLGNTPSRGVQVREIYVAEKSEFASRFPGAFVQSFDLSPDGAELAVEFETWESDATKGVWLTLWDVNARRLKKSIRLEEAVVRRDVQYRYQIEYSADGEILVALTGPRLLALRTKDWTIPHAIEAPVTPVWPPKEMFIHSFSLAGGVDRMALLYTFHRVFSETFEVRIVNLRDGRVESFWTGKGACSSIALSPGGEFVAVLRNPQSGMRLSENVRNLLLYRVDSGQLAASANTATLASYLFFLSDSELLSSAGDHFVPSVYGEDRIKVWNIPELTLNKQLDYETFGVRGPIAGSRNGQIIGAITHWNNPVDIRLDKDRIRAFDRFLLWTIRTSELVHVSADLQAGKRLSRGESKYLLRLSADGARVAVGGEAVSVYAIEKR